MDPEIERSGEPAPRPSPMKIIFGAAVIAFVLFLIFAFGVFDGRA